MFGPRRAQRCGCKYVGKPKMKFNLRGPNLLHDGNNLAKASEVNETNYIHERSTSQTRTRQNLQ